MNLILFDIDGTLTQTTHIDSTCFVQAVKDILKTDDFNKDWASYRYSTDSGLLKEIYESILQREPTLHELHHTQARFITYLNQAWSTNPSVIAPVPGADKLFQQISSLTDWHIGIATGGWKKTALFKLDSAHIPHTNIPKSYANDHIERTEIIKTTIKQAQILNHIEQYQHIIYVGDRFWDERAAMQLGINFIGIGDQIKQESTQFCIDDYNSESLLNYLQTI